MIFKSFYNALSEKNFLIYPGKLTVADTFRIGCIGNLDENDMQDTLEAIKEVVQDLNIRFQLNKICLIVQCNRNSSYKSN